MGDANPICTLGDYSRPSHEGYRNTIELLEGNNVVPLRSNTIRLVQNGCSFHELRSEDPNQHLKDFLKLVDSLDLDVANKKRTCLFPHRGFDLWLQVQIFYDHVNPATRRTIDQSSGGKLRDRNAKESWALLEDLTLYDNESWNDPKDFVRPVKAISLPQDVPRTSDRRLIKLENQIWSGPHDTQYCMENPEQAFVDYASSRIDEAGGGRSSRKVYRLMLALYGLKQAPRAWYDELSTFLISKGFSKGIFISQSKYAVDFLKKHGMEKCDSISTSMATSPKIDADLSGTPVDQTNYRSVIGLLMYLTSSRPELVQAVSCLDTHKSTSGGIQFLGDKLVGWMLKKQDCAAMSTAEAKIQIVKHLVTRSRLICSSLQSLCDICFNPQQLEVVWRSASRNAFVNVSQLDILSPRYIINNFLSTCLDELVVSDINVLGGDRGGEKRIRGFEPTSSDRAMYSASVSGEAVLFCFVDVQQQADVKEIELNQK
ncbi:MAK10-like protein [Tanacetum coccineum]